MVVPRLEPVRLGEDRVLQSVPRHVVAEEDAGHADAREVVVGRVGVRHEMLRLDAGLAHEVADPQAEQPAELLEPTPRQRVAGCRRGRAAVLVLRVLAPHDELDAHLHREPHRQGEDRDVLGPGDVADLRQREAVDAAPHDRVGRELDVVDAERLDVLDVAPADVESSSVVAVTHSGFMPELEHADHLRGGVLAAAHADDAVVGRAVGRAVAVEHVRRARPARVPVDLAAALEVPARAAHALVVEEDVGLGLRDQAAPAVDDRPFWGRGGWGELQRGGGGPSGFFGPYRGRRRLSLRGGGPVPGAGGGGGGGGGRDRPGPSTPDPCHVPAASSSSAITGLIAVCHTTACAPWRAMVSALSDRWYR